MSYDAFVKSAGSEESNPAGAGGKLGREPFISYETITALLPTIDLAIILAASIIAPILIAEFYRPPDPTSMHSLYGLALVASGIYVFRMRDLNHYEAHVVRSGSIELRQIFQTWAVSVIVLLSLIYMFQLGQINTRRTFVAFIAISFVALVGWRAAIKVGLRYASSRSAVGRANVLLIGDSDEFRLLDMNRLLDHFGVIDVTRFPISGGGDAPLSADDVAMIDRAIAYARESNAQEVLVVTAWSNTARLNHIREALRSLPIPARLLPDQKIRAITAVPALGSDQILQVELQRAPLTSWERGTKRAMDIIFASLALLLLWPLMAIAALLIKLESRGPVIFRQRRIGFNKHEFTIFKFRTMRVQEDGPVVVQASAGDSRVTPFGRFLRASSIDELPQLFNVLSGSMSLVGPRPHAIAHDYEFEDRLSAYAFRRHVKPGITGWAQCHGRRGPTPTVEDVRARVDLDLWYISNWSLSLDFYIMFRTVLVVLGQKNAF